MKTLNITDPVGRVYKAPVLKALENADLNVRSVERLSMDPKEQPVLTRQA